VKFLNIVVLAWAMFFFGDFESDSFAIKSQKESDKTIKIGILVQDNKSKEARNAAEMAVRKVNAKGGINGRLVKLIVRSMEGPWGTGSKQAVDMIFNEKVWAIIGSHDGRNAHLVEQATTKAHVIFLSAWASDPTLSQAFVPWFFNCVPNDRQQATAFIDEIYNKRKIAKIALVSDNGYDSKLASETFVKMSKKMLKPDPLLLSYNFSSTDFKELIDQINKAKVDGIVLSGQAPATKMIIKQLRQRNIKLPVFGTLSILGEQGFSVQDLKNSGNVVLISSGNNLLQKSKDFQKEYQKENGKIPGAVAAYAYDGLNLILEAIKNSGFDRDKVQNALLKMRYEGITGPIQFDEKGNRLGEPGLIEIKNGISLALKK